jgi:ABC-type Zn2+ transport system substrate-binding protein/surface adhesin
VPATAARVVAVAEGGSYEDVPEGAEGELLQDSDDPSEIAQDSQQADEEDEQEDHVEGHESSSSHDDGDDGNEPQRDNSDHSDCDDEQFWMSSHYRWLTRGQRNKCHELPR